MNSTGTFHNCMRVVVGLFRHNIKIAFRNLWKYKSQTMISIAGLAAGLTCFALSTLWIRYEMSFDSSHKRAKQLYVIYRSNAYNLLKQIPVPYAVYLKETFPEIANAAPIFAIPSYMGENIILEGAEIPSKTIAVDSNFFKMFDLELLAGSREFLIPGSDKMAITQEKARQLFGNQNPIGERINTEGRVSGTFIICAVISEMPKPSNYPFDFIRSITEEESQNWAGGNSNIIIELFPKTNIEVFKKKLKEHIPTVENRTAQRVLNVVPFPLKKMRSTAPDIERNVKFQDIIIFSISGLLVVLCSLFNYFISTVNRFYIRQKELALRLVFGASGRSLLAMLSVEFILIILFSVVMGLLLTQLFYDPFLTLSKIQMDLSSIYRELAMYLWIVLLVALLFFWLTLFVFRKRSLNASIRRSDKKLFQKISTVVQLYICMVFIFCTIIIQKQMSFLHHSHEMGFSIQNKGLIYSVPIVKHEVFINQLKQIPEITEVLDLNGRTNIFPFIGSRAQFEDNSWENKSADADNVSIHLYFVSPELVNFYDFQLVAGELLTAADPESFVLISEDAAKAYGWYDPVGKQVLREYGGCTVKGVVKNVYNYGPFQKPPAVAYIQEKQSSPPVVLFKYREGMWKSCKEKLEQLIDTEYADVKQFNTEIINSNTIENSEEYYNNRYLKSEIALQKLFSIFSTICVLICVFGFVSVVSLTCKERRKSIAIRKISGATSGDILAIFFKEYTWLVIIGAVIAFSTGYFFMQRWLEHFVKKTDIPAWIYLSILCAMALVIVLCVGYQVYKASVENPSEVIKTE